MNQETHVERIPRMNDHGDLRRGLVENLAEQDGRKASLAEKIRRLEVGFRRANVHADEQDDVDLESDARIVAARWRSSSAPSYSSRSSELHLLLLVAKMRPLQTQIGPNNRSTAGPSALIGTPGGSILPPRPTATQQKEVSRLSSAAPAGPPLRPLPAGSPLLRSEANSSRTGSRRTPGCFTRAWFPSSVS